MKKLQFLDKETSEYLRNCQKQLDLQQGKLMCPSWLDDEELDEYCRARSGEVKTYKLEEAGKDEN